MIGQGQYESLQRTVFSRAEASVFAVLDGCQVEGLPQRLASGTPESACLFEGQLDPMLQAAAPYLVKLEPDSAATLMSLREGWNAHWGIVLVADPGTGLSAVRSHLRRNLRVRGPGGEPLFFRFYDPRAFRSVVPTFEPGDRREFFGPISGVYVEGPEPDSALYFLRDGNEPLPVALPA